MQQSVAPSKDPPGADRLPILEIKNLHTYFFQETGTVRAVRGVNLRLDRQSVLGVVGESGCGKSITAMSVMQLIKSPPGRIVDGEILFHRTPGAPPVNLVDLDPAGSEMRQIRGGEIAVIFQEPMTSLNPLFSVGRQIQEAIQLHQPISDTQAAQQALAMLEKVQISEPRRRLHQYPHQLSGGMRQRVMIAMGLSCDPQLLIADEPTTALDVTIQAQIVDLVRRLQDELGMAIIWITHDLGVVAGMADRVLVMYSGFIVEEGNVNDIYANPRHPYTLGLLRSIPRLDLGRQKRLIPIDGLPPDLLEPPTHCPFAPRCSFVEERCWQANPVLEEVTPGHKAACWVDISNIAVQNAAKERAAA